MTLEEFGQLGITKTRFASLTLQAGMKAGVPIGQGMRADISGIKGVELSANHFIVHSVTPQSVLTTAKFYYGDSQQQSQEYLINTNTTAGNTNNRTTGFIPCSDLNEVFVRFSDATPATIEIQVRIYS